MIDVFEFDHEAENADFVMVKARILIRRVSDGVCVSFDDNIRASGDGVSCFWWEDGNGSCDCNRKLFFHRAVGQELDGDNTPCGDGGYQIAVYNPHSGRLLFSDIRKEGGDD